ncbi:MAG: glycoside hydrolase family 2 protein [Solobacterium sp.]|nr:glycoside hydrolase family 2 protein [Solobacterium sp.]
MTKCCKKIIAVLLGFVLCFAGFRIPVSAASGGSLFISKGRETRINEDWSFYLGDVQAEDPAYDDSSWQRVNLPHDWSVTQNFTTAAEAESGYLPGGTGWYRKTLIFPERTAGKRILLSFDGVYMNSTVYVNGTKMGEHPNGYTPFMYDISQEVICDGSTPNVIAVKVEHRTPDSRWYSGSGIYRDVSLIITGDTAVKENSIIVRTPGLEEAQDSAETEISFNIVNTGKTNRNLAVSCRILDEEGNPVGYTEENMKVSAGADVTAAGTITVKQPALWSPDTPALYTLRTELKEDGRVIDTVLTQFGYRYFHVDADSGFTLNGVPMKLQGVCMHHDQGALGAASYTAAIDRQLRILKDMGVNAIRTAHNTADRDLIRLCSEYGFLVIEESFDTWTNAKNFNMEDTSRFFAQTVGNSRLLGSSPEMTWAEYDLKAMIQRDRNEPSVIMWGVGNEILGNIGGDISQYPLYAQQLTQWANETDNTRPVTIGDNKTEFGDMTQLQMNEALLNGGGVIGLNYVHGDKYDEIHAAYPDWPLYASETVSGFYSRDFYRTYGTDGYTYQVSGFDTSYAEWGSSGEAAWTEVLTRPYLAGEFIWTGFDYIGEPEPWNNLTQGAVTSLGPAPHTSYFGAVDSAGLPKDIYYFYRSQWQKNSTTLHILPSWNSDEIIIDAEGYTDVVVYTNAPQAELFLNGESLGRKEYTQNTTEDGFTYQTCDGRMYMSWRVPYSPGKLEAYAYDVNGEMIPATFGRYEVCTSGYGTTAEVIPDIPMLTADGEDLSYVTVTLKDREGNPDTRNDRRIYAELRGEGKIIGINSGDQRDTQKFTAADDTHADRNTYHGKLTVIVQSTKKAGDILLTVSGEGIEPETVQLLSVDIHTYFEGLLLNREPDIQAVFNEMKLPGGEQ